MESQSLCRREIPAVSTAGCITITGESSWPYRPRPAFYAIGHTGGKVLGRWRATRSRTPFREAKKSGPVWKLLIPHPQDTVADEDGILRREREPFGDRLGHQDSVERIRETPAEPPRRGYERRGWQVPEFAIEGRIFPTRGAGRQSGHPGLCDLRTSSHRLATLAVNGDSASAVRACAPRASGSDSAQTRVEYR